MIEEQFANWLLGGLRHDPHETASLYNYRRPGFTALCPYRNAKKIDYYSYKSTMKECNRQTEESSFPCECNLWHGVSAMRNEYCEFDTDLDLVLSVQLVVV